MILSGHARDWSKGFDVARTATLYIGVTEIADLLKATHSSVATTAPSDPSTHTVQSNVHRRHPSSTYA